MSTPRLLFASLGIALAVVVFSTLILQPRDEKVSSHPKATDSLPRFGQSVYVEEFPDPIHKVKPVYPGRALAAGLEGKVVVHALVDRKGRVIETRVMQSDPTFDAAAVKAVRQWRFKPARSNGQPVAVWVAVPIRFEQ